MASSDYVHGYTERETRRLQEQSLILENLLHEGTSYASGNRVLEVGCGVGAQTLILLKRNPGILLTSTDMSAKSIQKARESVEGAGYTNVEFRHENIFDHGLAPGSYDHVFVCFVLEHLEKPVEALHRIMKLLKAGGAINQIIAPMVYSAEKYVLKKQLVDPGIWRQGLEDLSNVATSPDGTFFYSWFKGVGTRKN